MDNRPAVETTPLLSAHHSSDDSEVPPVTPVILSLGTADFAHLRWEDLTPQPLPASLEIDPCRRVAFALIVLLQLRKQKIAWNGKYTDIYERWTEEDARTRDIEVLEEKVNELWETFFAQYHGPLEIYDVLWSRFSLVQNESTTIRVVDFLVERNAPQKFVAHPIVSMSMDCAWKFGRPRSNIPETWLSNGLNTDATPRKIHFLELLFDLGFLLLLLSYVIHPPNWPNSDNKSQDPTANYSYTARELYLVLYAFSTLLSAQPATAITSSLTLLAFALALPSLPLPSSFAFSALLWAIFSRLLMYHIPTIPPTPLLLVVHQRSLPLAAFLIKALTRIIRPLLFVYFPSALVACFALSISLSGPLTGPIAYPHILQTIMITHPDPPIIGAAPMDTRVFFFLFSVTVLLIVLSSAYVLGTSTPVAHDQSVIWSSSKAWDFYSPEVGHDAHVASYHATSTYSMEYPFPPPFNLIELAFVAIPLGLIRPFSHRHAQRVALARFVWNLTVRPFVVITTTICAILA